MTTPNEYAKDATAALHRVLHISPNDFDAEETTAVIEQAIRNATRERESRARRQLKEVQAAAQERLARLLSSSPAVIYSFKATGDFAPTFVSDNISGVFGYAPAEYLEDPSFWRDRVHPDDLARVEDAISQFFQNGVHTVEYRFRRKDGSYCWVNDEQHLIRGIDGKPLGDRRIMERHHGAQGGGGGEGCSACPSVPVARQLAGGDLQLQGDGRFRADLRQPEHQGLAGLRAAGIPRTRGFLAALRAPRRPRRGGGRSRSICSRKATTRSSTDFSRRTAAIAG